MPTKAQSYILWDCREFFQGFSIHHVTHTQYICLYNCTLTVMQAEQDKVMSK